MRVLLAEDNPRLSTLISEGLAEQGFVLDCFSTLTEAEESIAVARYDLLRRPFSSSPLETGSAIALADSIPGLTTIW